MTTELTSKKAQSRALALVGAPWLAGGHSKRGCDCLGVVLHAFQIELTAEETAIAESVGYPRHARMPSMQASLKLEEFLSKHFVKVNDVPRPGDVVIYAVKENKVKKPDHVGVVVGNMVVHSTFANGVQLSPITGEYKLPLGVYRWG